MWLRYWNLDREPFVDRRGPFVETPTHLNARQKDLMRELASCCGETQHPRSAGFFDKAKRFWGDITGEAASV